MKRWSFKQLWAWACCLTCGLSGTIAQPQSAVAQPQNDYVQFAAQESLEASPPEALAHGAWNDGSGSCIDNSCEPYVGQDFWNPCPRSHGVVGGAEALFLKPFFQDRSTQTLPVAGIAAGQPASFNYDVVPRGWVGFVNESGLGVRGRALDYHATAGSDLPFAALGVPGTGTERDTLALRVFDLELTQQVAFRYWKLEAFGGARYAQTFGQSNFAATIPAGALVAAGGYSAQITNTFYGVGLTGGLQADRILTANGRWSFFVNGRGSILMGNAHRRTITSSPFGGTDTTRTVNDTYASIWELSFGPQWNCVGPSGGIWFARTGLEAQLWQNFGALNTSDILGSMSLAGFTASIGLTR